MAAFTKTQGTALISQAEIASGNVTVGSAVDVSTKIAGTVFLRFGRCATTALSQVFQFRIEASEASSGDTPSLWTPLVTYSSQTVAVESEAVSSTASSGQAVVPVASTTNLVNTPDNNGKLIFLRHGTPASSEWGRIKTVTSNTSVTLEENLVNAQTSSTIYAGAELWIAQLDFQAIGRIRVVADNSATGQTVAVKATMVTADSFG